MGLTVFQIVNYTLILILLILFIRYLWIVYIFHDEVPVQWRYALKNGSITPLIKAIRNKYPDKVRFYNWWFQVERLKREHVPGVFVELGVYQGDSARVIHHLDEDRPLHLFDTFSGFPANDLSNETGEAATYTVENFADTTMEAVSRKIAGNRQIIFHKGYFPATAAGFDEQVALVNLDADLYNPTHAALKLFYPLLSPGGVIMIHDYNYKWPGIIKAVDDFSKTIPEGLMLLPDVNGSVMIIRNK